MKPFGLQLSEVTKDEIRVLTLKSTATYYVNLVGAQQELCKPTWLCSKRGMDAMDEKRAWTHPRVFADLWPCLTSGAWHLSHCTVRVTGQPNRCSPSKAQDYAFGLNLKSDCTVPPGSSWIINSAYIWKCTRACLQRKAILAYRKPWSWTNIRDGCSLTTDYPLPVYFLFLWEEFEPPRWKTEIQEH